MKIKCPSSATIVYLLTITFIFTVGRVRYVAYGGEAEQILEATGVKGGLVVHLGCGDGRLTAAFHASDSYMVHGLDTDPNNVHNAREHIHSLELYGKVAVDQFSGNSLPFIDNLVNLIVVENGSNVPINEIMRVLRPKGVAYIKTGDTPLIMVKPWPDDIDEWTHYLHDASGNAVGHDLLVGPPRRFQWVGSPKWSRHHDRMASMSACVSANGRIFYIIDEGSRACIQLPSKWILRARDAFNGVLLWKRPIASWMTQLWPFKSGPAQLPRRLVTVGDRVYVTLGLDGTALSMLDAATGEIIWTYDGTEMTEEFIFSEGILFLMVKENPPATGWNEYLPIHRTIGQAKSRVASEWPWDQANRRVMAIQADSGDVLWEKKYPVAPLTLAADPNAVFFHDGEKVVCLNRHTGEQAWSSSPVTITSPLPSNFGPTLVVYNDVVLLAGGNPSRILIALSAKTGQSLWTSNYEPSGHNCPHDLLVIDGLAWAGATAGGGHSGIFTGWVPNTGEVKKQFSPDVDIYWFHHRCYRARATDKYILPSRAGVEFIDFRAEKWTTHHWVRGGCLYGIMPCNGLLYTPPHNCACYFESKLSGFCALAAAHTDRQYPQVTPDNERLQLGSAYGMQIAAPLGAKDWPTYRHDNERSGYTQSIVPADLKLSWQTQLKGNLTSPVIANGRIYVASTDIHTVYALDENSGGLLWRYTAGGRVDSPPTIYNGRVLFGCADGWIYCLQASDGQLVWRFQAAPQDLRLPSYEQMESVWPVPGNVLILNDRVYCVAGRSMFLDGGLRFLRLDPTTGNKISEIILDDRDPNSGENLQVHVKRLNMPVALPDILSSDGQYVFMRSQQFDLEGTRLQIPPHSGDHDEQGSQQYGEGMHLFCPTGFLENTYMHRTYWVFGRSWASGAGGYYRAGRFAPAGRIMVFDDSRVYSYGRQPQYFKWSTPLEYQLFAAEKFPDSQSIEYHWTNESVPLLAQAMVLADKILFLAGPQDLVDEEQAFDYWTADPNDPGYDPNIPIKLDQQDIALGGGMGALLWAVDPANGNKLAEYNLESLPVWDGMAAANGRLYLSLKNGKVQCFVGVNYPPRVNAGEDQSIYPMASAILNGIVTDDGMPRIDPDDPNSPFIGVTTNWSKLEGAGEVTFDDPCAVHTTASFSQWGEYTLRLTAFDGGSSYYDDMNIHVFRPGDLDRDYDVDVFDLNKLLLYWLHSKCNPLDEWCRGADQTASGEVDFGDYAVTTANWLLGVEPVAPVNVTADPGNSQVYLNWDDNSEADLAGYHVYRSVISGSDYTRINQTLLAASEYLDETVTNCVNYYYVVTAVDTFGYESPYSEEVFVSPGIQPVMKLMASMGVITDNAEISTWKDLAKNNHARQDTSGDRPVLVSSAINGQPAIDFDGAGDHLKVADSEDLNTGGPYSGKTLVVVFKTGSDIINRQIIWEQGGGSRGLSIYLDYYKLFINGWNLNETQWGPTALYTYITTDTAYVATLVMDADNLLFEGFVNGTSIGSVDGISQLYNHSNDCAFGHVEGATKFHDASTAGPANFTGQIAEFYQFNHVLSSTDRQSLEGSLMDKYGTGSLF